jgi:hypothetical protein
VVADRGGTRDAAVAEQGEARVELAKRFYGWAGHEVPEKNDVPRVDSSDFTPDPHTNGNVVLASNKALDRQGGLHVPNEDGVEGWHLGSVPARRRGAAAPTPKAVRYQKRT